MKKEVGWPVFIAVVVVVLAVIAYFYYSKTASPPPKEAHPLGIPSQAGEGAPGMTPDIMPPTTTR